MLASNMSGKYLNGGFGASQPEFRIPDDCGLPSRITVAKLCLGAVVNVNSEQAASI